MSLIVQLMLCVDKSMLYKKKTDCLHVRQIISFKFKTCKKQIRVLSYVLRLIYSPAHLKKKISLQQFFGTEPNTPVLHMQRGNHKKMQCRINEN